MAKTVAIKPEENLARSYADRLILEQLTEMESVVRLGELADRLSSHGLGLAAVKSLLATNPQRFAYSERRWVPAARIDAIGRSLNEAVRLQLTAFGAPMPMKLLLREVALNVGKTEEELAEILRRLIDRDKIYILDSNDKVSWAIWSFEAHDETLERALAINRISTEEYEAAKAKLGKIDWRSPSAAADALKAAAPIRAKVIGAVAFGALNSDAPHSPLMYDGRKLFAQIVTVPGYEMAADGTLAAADESKKWLQTAIKVAEKLAPTVEVEDAAPIEVGTEEVKKLVKKITSEPAGATGIKMLEEFFEITPSNKTFPDDLANLLAALQKQPEVVWVGGDRFRKAGAIPDYINSVPEPFQFSESVVQNEEGELVDVELTDEGLNTSLRKMLGHPLATDVLDEDIMPAPKTMPDSVRLVLKSIHRELGTFPLCQIPTGWLDAEPTLQELIWVDPQGRELQVWINQDARLAYNLIDWWFEQSVECGAVFTLSKTSQPNVLEFEWLDQPDPVVYISTQRMEELRTLAEGAEGRSTLDLLIDTMAHWPKGADYLTILAEMNVVRRSSRRLIASLLSSYQCFYQRSGSPVWHYDPKKLELGFDKSKKKFIKK